MSSSLLSKNVKIKIYRTIIFRVVVYGCETWWLTLREERRLRVFENRVLRRIFGPKREEITGGGENYKMRSFMICNPQSSGDQIEKNEMGGACNRYRRGVYRVLLGKGEGNRPPGRTRRRWEDNIIMDLQEVRWGWRHGLD
jgi:hypothetical protein